MTSNCTRMSCANHWTLLSSGAKRELHNPSPLIKCICCTFMHLRTRIHAKANHGALGLTSPSGPAGINSQIPYQPGRAIAPNPLPRCDHTPCLTAVQGTHSLLARYSCPDAPPNHLAQHEKSLTTNHCTHGPHMAPILANIHPTGSKVAQVHASIHGSL